MRQKGLGMQLDPGHNRNETKTIGLKAWGFITSSTYENSVLEIHLRVTHTTTILKTYHSPEKKGRASTLCRHVSSLGSQVAMYEHGSRPHAC